VHAVTTVLVCARPDLETDLSRTLFWRDDLERYVADRADEARTLALSTEPHVVVVDLHLGGALALIEALRSQPLPHPISIVAVREGGVEGPTTTGIDTVLSLPSGPAWDDRLVEVLTIPTRKQARYEVHLDVLAMIASHAVPHRGLALNMSAGGILVESPELRLRPGDDVNLSLPLPEQRSPVESRARVVRLPGEEHVGLRFEAFAGDGYEKIQDYLAALAAGAPPGR
jgi:PilZ domain-containing protein